MTCPVPPTAGVVTVPVPSVKTALTKVVCGGVISTMVTPVAFMLPVFESVMV